MLTETDRHELLLVFVTESFRLLIEEYRVIDLPQAVAMVIRFYQRMNPSYLNNYEFETTDQIVKLLDDVIQKGVYKNCMPLGSVLTEDKVEYLSLFHTQIKTLRLSNKHMLPRRLMRWDFDLVAMVSGAATQRLSDAALRELQRIDMEAKELARAMPYQSVKKHV